MLGWHGQAPLVRAESECAVNGYLPFSRTDNANSPPDRIFAKSLLAAYLPGLQKETTQRVVSAPPTSNPSVVPANYNPRSAFRTPKSTNSGSQNPKLDYGFTVASYGKTKDLIIDPLLVSTFLGGTGADVGYSLTYSGGFVYVTGMTSSPTFPAMGGAYKTLLINYLFHNKLYRI